MNGDSVEVGLFALCGHVEELRPAGAGQEQEDGNEPAGHVARTTAFSLPPEKQNLSPPGNFWFTI